MLFMTHQTSQRFMQTTTVIRNVDFWSSVRKSPLLGSLEAWTQDEAIALADSVSLWAPYFLSLLWTSGRCSVKWG